MESNPQLILLFNGKRKSGKDYVTDILKERIGDKCVILRLSAPLKKEYAKDHNLDFSRLLDASEYKEKYRADMIRWGEEKRNQDPGFFCRATCAGSEDKAVWIISDARRQTDVDYFQNTYPGRVVTVRVTADESVRSDRGWVFTPGIDDAESECGLDHATCDIVFTNNGDRAAFNRDMDILVSRVEERVL